MKWFDRPMTKLQPELLEVVTPDSANSFLPVPLAKGEVVEMLPIEEQHASFPRYVWVRHNIEGTAVNRHGEIIEEPKISSFSARTFKVKKYGRKDNSRK